jgi:hypothetical protein
MRYVVCDRVGLSRPPEGPLASYIVSFANSMESKGYSVQSLRHQVRIVAGFSQWLARSGVELHRVCSEHASQYLRYRARRVRAGRGTVLHFDISSSFCTNVASFVLNAQPRAAGRRLNAMPRHMDSTCVRCVVWPNQRLRITRRSPQISCKTASATGGSICHVYVRAMSSDLYSARPNVCI